MSHGLGPLLASESRRIVCLGWADSASDEPDSDEARCPGEHPLRRQTSLIISCRNNVRT